jgi:hypothetical protein
MSVVFQSVIRNLMSQFNESLNEEDYYNKKFYNVCQACTVQVPLITEEELEPSTEEELESEEELELPTEQELEPSTNTNDMQIESFLMDSPTLAMLCFAELDGFDFSE